VRSLNRRQVIKLRRWRKPLRSQAGVALIFTILIALVLGSLAVFFSVQAQSHVRAARLIGDAIEARLIAKSKMQTLVFALSSLNYQSPKWPTQNSDWRPSFDGSFALVEPDIRVSVQDLGSRFSLVPLVKSEWVGLLESRGLSQIQATALLEKVEDWMDSDDLRRLQGMERRGYQYLNLDYEPRNKLMQSTSELRWIPGMSAELYDSIVREVSYWGTRERSPLLGSKDMIRAYVGPDQVDTLWASREQGEDLKSVYNRLDNVDPSLVTPLLSGVFRLQVQVTKGEASATRAFEINMRGTDVFPYYWISAR
jgi:general secretion pathway protein K